ncbi:MAG: aspartyl protease family protein [Opitutaceae bacterium]
MKPYWLLAFAIVVGSASVQADDRILIDVKLNGQPLSLAFDTGAGGLVIFRSVAEKRGLKIEPPPEGTQVKPGEVSMGLTEPVTLELAEQTFPNTRLNVLDTLSALPPMDIDGVVGWPNLRKNIWALSGSTLHMTGLAALPPETAKWVKLREVPEQDLLHLELPRGTQQKPSYLSIDTGADFGVALSAEAWKKWRAANPNRPVTIEAYYMPSRDLIISEYAWADEIEVGGLKLAGLTVREMNEVETVIGLPDKTAVLGLGAMLRMESVLDGQNGFAYFHPLNTPPRNPVHNRLGAIFVPKDPKTTDDLIAHVAKGSPAEKAGVRNGDILLKIDELDVTPWRTQPGILPLRRFFEQAPDTKLHLTLRRSGKVISVDAVLRNIIGPKSSSR